MGRKLLSLAVVAVALLVPFLASRARRLGARVDAMELDPQEGIAGLGDDLPYRQMRIALVENVLGDDAMLDDLLGGVAEHGGADVLVLLGNVLHDGTDAEARRLVATCRDRGMPVLAVPSAHDRDPAVRDVYARWFGPERWWFLSRGTLVVGVPGRGADDDAFVAKALADAPGATTFRVCAARPVSGVDRPKLVVPRQRNPSMSSAAILLAGADEQSGGILGWGSGGRTPVTPGSLWRALALGVLYPMTKETAGYVALLLASAVVAAIGVRGVLTSRTASHVAG